MISPAPPRGVRAVKGEGDAVENGALARAGVPEDAEQPLGEELPEVDLGGLGEGIDPVELQIQRLHASSMRARKAALSSSLGGSPYAER